MDKKGIIMIIAIIVILVLIIGVVIYTLNEPSMETKAQNIDTSFYKENLEKQQENNVISSNETNVINVEMNGTQLENLSNSNNSLSKENKTYTINNVSFNMIYVEAGTFTMGSNDTNVAYSESPAHKVTLTQDYFIGETEVTESLWNAVMENGEGSNTMPKTSVTWKQAHTFIDNLNKIAHEQGIIPESANFRLPTEAQWEYAAKGGNKSKGYKYSGGNNVNDVAVTLENSGSSSPIEVKSKSPNELGIYDMSGNAYEWVDDYAGSYSSEDQVDPQNTTPSNSYVKRGGSNYHNFNSESYLFTTTGRYFYGSTDWTIGFRIALQ